MKANKSGAITMDGLRQLPDNKKCFDCGQKSPMYVVTTYWVFVCSTCAGIHRELNNKVKGVAMSTFSEAELKELSTLGNLNQQTKLMAEWSAKVMPFPDKTDNFRMKEFFKAKYVDKRFADGGDSDSDSDSSDDKKKKKKKKDKKKKKSKKKKETSSESESEEDVKPAKKAKTVAPSAASSKAKKDDSDESDGGDQPFYKPKAKTSTRRKLGAPPSNSSNQVSAAQSQPKVDTTQPKSKPVPTQAPPQQSADLLSFDSSANSVPASKPVAKPADDDWGNDWGDFDSTPQQNTSTQPQLAQAVPPQQPTFQQPPPQQQHQSPPQQFQQAAPSNDLADIFSAPSQPQPNNNNPGAMGGAFNQLPPTQAGVDPFGASANLQPQQQQQQQPQFKPMLANNMATRLDDPFNDYMRDTKGQNPLTGGAMPTVQNQGMGQQMPGQNQPAQQMGQPGNQQQQMQMMQQMMMLQQQMQNLNMNGQGGGQNMQQMQYMQNMMGMMQQQMQGMNNQNQNQFGAPQNPGMQGGMQQMPQQNMGGGFGMGGPPQQNKPQDSLSNLFNDIAKKPAGQNQNQFNPGMMGQNQPQQPSGSQGAQQNNNQYNPFDL